MDNSIEQESKAVRWVIIGSIIAEYGAMMLNGTKGELKMRANAVIRDSRRLQDWFKFHPNSGEKYRKIFEQEFSKNEIIALAELMETCWAMDEDSIQEVISAINKNCATI